MRILVVGAGATGAYFGARLANAGRDVTFFVRPARAQRLATDGLQIVSPHGDLHLEPQLLTALQEIPIFDVIILAVKAYTLNGALDDLAPAIGSQTMIVPFLNGMRHIDTLTARFGEETVLGGVCRITSAIDERGRIVQLSGLQQLLYGERSGQPSERVDALDRLMQGAGFEASHSLQIMQEMWEKWVMLAALGATTCLLRGNIGEIEAVSGGAELALAILAECCAVASAASYPPRAETIERIRSMLTMSGSMLTPSMYRDLESGQNVEADQIVGDLVARGQQFGLATPLLTAALISLRVYARRLTHAGSPAHAVA